MKRSGPLKRKTRPKHRTPARKDQEALYAALWAMWLPGRRCEAKLGEAGPCLGGADQVHHAYGRNGARLLNVATFRAVCGPCHRALTDHRVNPYEVGPPERRLSYHRYEEPPLMAATPTECKACRATIVFASTPAGASIPLDADRTGPVPHPGTSVKGRVVLDQQHVLFDDGALRVRILKEDEDPDPAVEVWVSHFASCPEAGRFRR